MPKASSASPEQNGTLPFLDTFAQVAQSGGFTAAARSLQVTQAAVSGRIRTLEEQLGARLFDRGAGGAALTEAGRVLYAYARQIVALHEEARQKLTGVAAALSGDLVLAASSVPGEHLLPRLLWVFRQRYPQVQVRVSVSDSGQVLRMIAGHEATLGLIGVDPAVDDFESVAFATDRLVLLVPADHPWAAKKRVTVRQLADQPLVLREQGSGSRQCFERAWEENGGKLSQLQVALELGSNEAIKEALYQGLGAAILSRYTVEQEVASGKLRALTVTGLKLDRQMHLVWDRRRALTSAARAFVDTVAGKG